MSYTNARIESELEIRTYLQKLQYALDQGRRFHFKQKGLSIRIVKKNIPINTL